MSKKSSKKDKTNIFVSYHKEYKKIPSDILVPIHVGRTLATEAVRKQLSSFVGDDTKDNISDKNTNYCELTSQYWVWKNRDADNIGFFHYRRFLNLSLNPSLPVKITEVNTQTVKDYGLTSENVEKLMSEYDIVVPEFYDLQRFSLTAVGQYAQSHNINDLKIVCNIICKDYPEFIPAMEEYLRDNKSMYCNMFITKKEIFNDYSAWLFDILFKAEKLIQVSEDPYQKRVFGFLSERLLNIYVKNLQRRNPNLKILHANIVDID